MVRICPVLVLRFKVGLPEPESLYHRAIHEDDETAPF